MDKYRELKVAADNRGERKDCAVKAVAVVTDKPYGVAHAKLKAMGRQDKRATPYGLAERAVKQMGKKLIKLPVEHKTVRVFGRNLEKDKVYLIGTRGHILGARDGKIQDWTDGRCHRIEDLYLVVNPEDYEQEKAKIQKEKQRKRELDSAINDLFG